MTYWHHGPLHIATRNTTYMVTGGTLHKKHLFSAPEHLDMLQETLHAVASDHHIILKAWALFSNHYHIIFQNQEEATTLRKMINHFHSMSARRLNALTNNKGRTVWHQYWDTQLTHSNSYHARLNYVMQNPVYHNLVDNAEQYPWCSTRWFKANHSVAEQRTVSSFKIDLVRVVDDF